MLELFHSKSATVVLGAEHAAGEIELIL